MNREQTLEAIKVMQHFADGGEVEYLCTGDGCGQWHDDEPPHWNWHSSKYRIKPKPLECWVVVDRDGDTSNFRTKAGAEEYAWDRNRRGLYVPYTVRHMREVTE